MLSLTARLSLNRLITRAVLSAERNKIVLKSLYATFTARDFVGEQSHGEVGTLNTRFIKYLAMEKAKFDPLTAKSIKYSDIFPLRDIKTFNKTLFGLPNNQLPRVVIFISTFKNNADPKTLSLILNKIDERCTKCVPDISCDELLELLYSFMFALPNKITKLSFYEAAINKLTKEFDSGFPKEKFVHLCFYIGLNKKNGKNAELLKEFVLAHLSKYIESLNKIEFAIVSNACYKASLLITDDVFRNHLVKETMNCDPKDDAILTTFIKSLRLNRIKSEDVCEKLKAHLLAEEMKHFHFKGLVHCFAYFAENLWNEPEVCKLMMTKCFTKLRGLNEDPNPFNDMRPKDLSTFLWCCAYLDIQDLNSSNFDFIEEIILRKIKHNEYEKCFDELVDSVLSLWMLGHKAKELVSTITSLNMKTMGKRSERVKLDSRFNLLMNCIQLETPWLAKNKSKERIFDETRKAPDFLIENRSGLKVVFEVLQKMKGNLSLKLVDVVIPIKEINIAGIFVKSSNDQKGFIEVLEKDQILKFGQEPISIVKLKLRLLKTLGSNVLVIGPEDYSDTNNINEKVKEFLREKPQQSDTQNIENVAA